MLGLQSCALLAGLSYTYFDLSFYCKFVSHAPATVSGEHNSFVIDKHSREKMLSAPFDFNKCEIPGATGSREAAQGLLTVSETNHPHPSTGAWLGEGGLQGRSGWLRGCLCDPGFVSFTASNADTSLEPRTRGTGQDIKEVSNWYLPSKTL